MTNNAILFFTDPHGNRYAFERAFQLAEERSINTIVLGGDLTPKRVSVKLADYEPIDEEEAYFDCSEVEQSIPGKIIPLALLKPAKHGIYLESLLKIEALNTAHAEQLEEAEVNRGNIIYCEENAFYSLEFMILEHTVLTKLFDFFSNDQQFDSLLEFSEDEISITDDFIHILKSYESSLSTEKKERLRNKWSTYTTGKGLIYPKVFGLFTKEFSFDELSPSENLMRYVAYGNRMKDIVKLKTVVTKFITEQNSSVGNLFLKEIECIPTKVELAICLLSTYPVDSFRILTENTSLQQLQQNAEASDVYINGQRDFVNGYFRDKLIAFTSDPNKKVYLILGNDDMTEIEDDIKKLHDEGLITYISQTVADLGNGISIAGYPFVKESKQFYAGWEKEEGVIATDLACLAQKSEPGKTIYVCHSPPHNGDLDIAYNGEHIGSEAIANFIEEYQPLAVLSGHVHESHKKSGKVMERRRNTHCFNPGGDHSKNTFRAIILNPSKPENYEVIEK